MLTTTEKLKFLSLGSKYKINVIEYSQGYIMLAVGTWHDYTDKFIQLIESLKKLPYVQDIVYANGAVEIYYEPSIVQNPDALETIAQTIFYHA